MSIKTKFESSMDKNNLYSWMFVNGIMTILNDKTFVIKLKENYVHRTPFYEINLIRKEKQNNNGIR